MRLVRTVIPVLLLATVAFAQTSIARTPSKTATPATQADILRLFKVLNVQDQVRQTVDQIMRQMRTMNREELKKRRPEITEKQLAKMDHDSEEIARSFPVNDLMNDMVPVYQKHLTTADVNAIIAFYASPTGKKMLREMPAMMTEGMQAAYPRIQQNLDEIMKRIDEKQAED